MLIAREIAEILQQGLRIDAAVQHYIDSTFSNPTLTDIETIINDDANPDKDALIELLLFPDEAIKAHIETLLDNTCFDKQDERQIIEDIASQNFPASFHLNDNEVLSLGMSASEIRLFVSRLNISKPLNAQVAAVIDQYVDESLKSVVKVRLRAGAESFLEKDIPLLCDFLEKMRSQRRLFLKSLDFFLLFLNEVDDPQKIYEKLIDRKWFYFQNIQKSQGVEEQLRKNNIETLMMQGIRVTLIDEADAREKMEIIDGICRALFGKTEYFSSMGGQVDSAQFHQDDDMNDVIRKLS